nr:amidohydrolase family protein [Sunxiuqinia sp.]
MERPKLNRLITKSGSDNNNNKHTILLDTENRSIFNNIFNENLMVLKTFYLITIVISLIACQSEQEKTYQRMKSYTDSIKVVDTHEHHIATLDSTHGRKHFFSHMFYFECDLRSAGWTGINEESDVEASTGEIWDTAEEFYRYSRATSYHAQLVKGYQILYEFDKNSFSKEDVLELEKKVQENYQHSYREWFDSAFQRGNFEIMLVDQYWDQYDVNHETPYYALVFRIDELVLNIADAAFDKTITDANLLKLLKSEPIPVSSLDDYIAIVDSALKLNVANNAVSIKNGLAYRRSIDFEYVSSEEANLLFDRQILSPEEQKKLQDYMFHWVIKKSIVYELPIQIHTGYLHGNSWADLENGHPMKLLPIILRYPDAKFVLFHGGYPWTSEFVAMGKHFHNVYLDLVWLPQISRTVAIRTLHEILDCVPYNKISWGGDVTTIEESVGSLEIAREVIAKVLSERIEKGWLTDEVAYDIARRILRENAMQLYHLNEKTILL